MAKTATMNREKYRKESRIRHDCGSDKIRPGAMNISVAWKRDQTRNEEMASSPDIPKALITKITDWDDF